MRASQTHGNVHGVAVRGVERRGLDVGRERRRCRAKASWFETIGERFSSDFFQAQRAKKRDEMMMTDNEIDDAIANASANGKDDERLAYDIAKRCTALRNRKLAKVFDAKGDGWRARAFHERCDGAGPAIVLARTRAGTVVGGYNPVGWYSVEDYRSCSGAFLITWARGTGEEETYANGIKCANVSDPAIYDFGAQGPCFGSDGLQIPLGFAPKHGSSYAGVGGSFDLGENNERGSRMAKSRLGSNFAAPAGTTMATLFAQDEGFEVELEELCVFAAPALRREDDGSLYVS